MPLSSSPQDDGSWHTAYSSPVLPDAELNLEGRLSEEPDSVSMDEIMQHPQRTYSSAFESQVDDDAFSRRHGGTAPERSIGRTQQLRALAGQLHSDIAVPSSSSGHSILGSSDRVGSPRWRDTEARVGVDPIPKATATLPQVDPRSLLARFMREEPLDIREIEVMISFYLLLTYILMPILALSNAGVGSLWVWYPGLFVFSAIVLARHIMHILGMMFSTHLQAKQKKDKLGQAANKQSLLTWALIFPG